MTAATRKLRSLLGTSWTPVFALQTLHFLPDDPQHLAQALCAQDPF